MNFMRQGIQVGLLWHNTPLYIGVRRTLKELIVRNTLCFL